MDVPLRTHLGCPWKAYRAWDVHLLFLRRARTSRRQFPRARLGAGPAVQLINVHCCGLIIATSLLNKINCRRRDRYTPLLIANRPYLLLRYHHIKLIIRHRAPVIIYQSRLKLLLRPKYHLCISAFKIDFRFLTFKSL